MNTKLLTEYHTHLSQGGQTHTEREFHKGAVDLLKALASSAVELEVHRSKVHATAELGCYLCVVAVRRVYDRFPVLASSQEAKLLVKGLLRGFASRAVAFGCTSGRLWVPWGVADEAWNVYAHRYGSRQSVERIAQRGGFGIRELDVFAPSWHEAVEDDHGRLR